MSHPHKTTTEHSGAKDKVRAALSGGHWVTIKHDDGSWRHLYLQGRPGRESKAQRAANDQAIHQHAGGGEHGQKTLAEHRAAPKAPKKTLREKVAEHKSGIKPSVRETIASRKAVNSGGERPDALLTSKHVRAMKAEPMRSTRHGYEIASHTQDVASKAQAARNAKAAELRAQRKPPTPKPAGPSLRDQAASHRAAKGTREERKANLLGKAKSQLGRLNDRTDYELADRMKASGTKKGQAEGKRIEAASKAFSARASIVRGRLKPLGHKTLAETQAQAPPKPSLRERVSARIKAAFAGTPRQATAGEPRAAGAAFKAGAEAGRAKGGATTHLVKEQAAAHRAGKGGSAPLRRELATQARVLRSHSLDRSAANATIKSGVAQHLAANTDVAGFKATVSRQQAKQTAKAINAESKAKQAAEAKVAAEKKRQSDSELIQANVRERQGAHLEAQKKTLAEQRAWDAGQGERRRRIAGEIRAKDRSRLRQGQFGDRPVNDVAAATRQAYRGAQRGDDQDLAALERVQGNRGAERAVSIAIEKGAKRPALTPPVPPKPSLRRTLPARVTVHADTARLHGSLAKDKSYYVGPGGTGAAKPGAYANVKAFKGKGDHPRVGLHAGEASVEDGRHRLALAAEQGRKTVAVSVHGSEAAEFHRKFGAAAQGGPRKPGAAFRAGAEAARGRSAASRYARLTTPGTPRDRARKAEGLWDQRRVEREALAAGTAMGEGGSKRVHLDELRARIGAEKDVFHRATQRLARRDKASLFRNDNPTEARQHEAYSTPSGEERHLGYFGGRPSGRPSPFKARQAAATATPLRQQVAAHAPVSLKDRTRQRLEGAKSTKSMPATMRATIAGRALEARGSKSTFAELRATRLARESGKAPAAQAPPVPSPTANNPHDAIHEAFRTSPGSEPHSNLVRLDHLRARMGGTREQQDAAIRSLIGPGKPYSLESHEGLGRAPDAALKAAALKGNQRDRRDPEMGHEQLMYITRRADVPLPASAAPARSAIVPVVKPAAPKPAAQAPPKAVTPKPANPAAARIASLPATDIQGRPQAHGPEVGTEHFFGGRAGAAHEAEIKRRYAAAGGGDHDALIDRHKSQERVKISDLLATQKGVNRQTVQDMAALPNVKDLREQGNLPLIDLAGDAMVIREGHTRLAALAASGHTHADVHVVRLPGAGAASAPKPATSLREQVAAHKKSRKAR